jgi:TPR repeat protein
MDTTMDLTQASSFLETAVDQQQPNVQHEFATLLWNGRGVAKDRTRAVHYFGLAANQGFAKA